MLYAEAYFPGEIDASYAEESNTVKVSWDEANITPKDKNCAPRAIKFECDVGKIDSNLNSRKATVKLPKL